MKNLPIILAIALLLTACAWKNIHTGMPDLSQESMFSCGGRKQSSETSNNQDSLIIVEEFGWYGDDVPRSSGDSSCIMPNYVYSTDWMQRYIQYIEKNFNGVDGLWTMKGEEFFDCRYWSIANVNNDTIPEMFLYGGCWVAGSRILTQYNGKVYMSPGCGSVSYIDGADGLIHSQDSHSDDLWGGVYEMEKGRFVEKCTYYRFASKVDISEVDKYGLEKDSISSWLVNDDGTVEIRGTILNGKMIDARYAWSSDKGKNKLKKTMDSLYYSKGKSIYFPKPRYTEKTLLSIDELLKKQIKVDRKSKLKDSDHYKYFIHPIPHFIHKLLKRAGMVVENDIFAPKNSKN